MHSNLCRTCRNELQSKLSRVPRAALCRLATAVFEKQNLRSTLPEALRPTTARMLEPSALRWLGTLGAVAGGLVAARDLCAAEFVG